MTQTMEGPSKPVAKRTLQTEASKPHMTSMADLPKTLSETPLTKIPSQKAAKHTGEKAPTKASPHKGGPSAVKATPSPSINPPGVIGEEAYPPSRAKPMTFEIWRGPVINLKKATPW